MVRSFQDKPARRKEVPLLIGLMGPSGGGKTFSALRLASGIQRITGGDIGYIDTEAGRALHYADRFTFRHMEFGAPFGPLEYLAAIEHYVKKGCRIVVVDSMSHEHEGRGGVLEMHQQEAERLADAWGVSLDKAKMSAWQKPKSERRRMIDSVLQMHANFIFCFRAKQKLKIEKKKDPEPRGFMPIAGEEFVFEMTVNCLLLPNAGGIPTWDSEYEGERMMIKLPEQFREIFKERAPLSQDIGEKLARWAAGDVSTMSAFAQLRIAIAEANDMAALDELVPKLKEVPDKKLMPGPDYKELKRLFAERKKYLEDNPPDHDPVTGEVPPELGPELGASGPESEPEREPGAEG